MSESVGASYDEIMVWCSFAVGTTAIHHAYLDGPNDATPLAVALDRMTQVIASKLGLSTGKHLLDVGCGAGQPDFLIAMKTSCSVTGVNVGIGQIATARASARTADVPSKLTFQVANAHSLPFSNDTFDAVLFFESLAHVPDPALAVDEAARCLRPGGRIVVAETTEIPALQDDAWRARIAEVFPEWWPLNLARLSKSLVNAGLVVQEVADLTAHTRDAMARYVHEAELNREEAVAALGEERFDGVLKIVKELAKLLPKHTGYAIVTASKP